MSAGLLATLLVALEVHASGDCPAASDVERHLGPLLGDGAAVSDVATLTAGADGAVSVSLADAGGQAIGDRNLPRARTCSEQAKTVAVMLAVWEAQLHPEISLRLDRLTPEPPPPRPRPPEVLTWQTSAPYIPWQRHERSVGIAAVGDYQSGGLAPGARLELARQGQDSRWRARLAVTAVGRHTIAVPPGRAAWWRAFVQLGGDYEIARGRRWAFVLGAGAVGGVVSISGDGFAENHSTRSVDVGGEARARLEWRPDRHVRPWLGAQAAGWLRSQALDLQGAPSSAALPRVEPMAALGADFVW
jgi:hypothetical protein